MKDKKSIKFSQVPDFEEGYVVYSADMDDFDKEIGELEDKLKRLHKQKRINKESFFDAFEVQLIKLGLIDSTKYDFSINEKTKEIEYGPDLSEDQSEVISNILGNIFGKK